MQRVGQLLQGVPARQVVRARGRGLGNHVDGFGVAQCCALQGPLEAGRWKRACTLPHARPAPLGPQGGKAPGGAGARDGRRGRGGGQLGRGVAGDESGGPARWSGIDCARRTYRGVNTGGQSAPCPLERRSVAARTRVGVNCGANCTHMNPLGSYCTCHPAVAVITWLCTSDFPVGGEAAGWGRRGRSAHTRAEHQFECYGSAAACVVRCEVSEPLVEEALLVGVAW